MFGIGFFLHRNFVHSLIRTNYLGGTERVINTKSTTVVEDIVEDLCNVIGTSNHRNLADPDPICFLFGSELVGKLSSLHRNNCWYVNAELTEIINQEIVVTNFEIS